MKILVFGFPHCGTSILKSIIAHIDDVDEVVEEATSAPDPRPGKNHIVVKFPWPHEAFVSGKEYADYAKIFVMRNPLWVFSSLNKRFGSTDLWERHRISDYERAMRWFVQWEECGLFFKVRYEDLFPNDYARLREILDTIGLRYTDRIFDNSQFTNATIPTVKGVPEEEPDNRYHAQYRTYQINQPIRNMNDPEKLDLSSDQLRRLSTDRWIAKVYPDLLGVVPELS